MGGGQLESLAQGGVKFLLQILRRAAAVGDQPAVCLALSKPFFPSHPFASANGANCYHEVVGRIK